MMADEILTPEQFDVQLQNIRWHAILGEDEMAASAEDLVRRHEHALRAERDRLAAEVERLRERYADLIYGVATKHPGESRHDTAKRYILERENRTARAGRGPDGGTVSLWSRVKCLFGFHGGMTDIRPPTMRCKRCGKVLPTW